MTHATTPFGRRPLTLAVVATQAATRAFVAQADATAAVHKWRLFRALTEAKARFGVGDRALSVLYALLSCHPETALTPPGPEDEARAALTVFPSNRELSLRAHGMAPATLRRHLASLVEAGLILRRDSANGKRFSRKSAGGEITEAFGFDLTPLVMRAEEIEAAADAARAEARARALLRERITLARRDVAKMIETGLAESLPGDWTGLSQRLAALCADPLRQLAPAQMEARATALAALADETRKLLEDGAFPEKMSASESRNERLIQNQTTNHYDFDSGLSGEEAGAALELKATARTAETTDAAKDAARDAAREGTGEGAFPLGLVLSACPDIADFATDGLRDWEALRQATEIARAALGVSPDAWAQARDAMGARNASIAIAAILQRGEEIASAGGYLRALTAKAREGGFSPGPLLMTLLRRKTGGGEARRVG